MAEFGGSTLTVARKPYCCAICGNNIQRGEHYQRYKGKWQGEWQNWPAHYACYENHDGGEVEFAGYAPKPDAPSSEKPEGTP